MAARIEPSHTRYVNFRFDAAALGRRCCCTVDEDDHDTVCPHLAHIKFIQPTQSVCADCVLLGDEWLQLRMCTECGYVGCCDSSTNKHAVKHFRATLHPITRSIQPGEEWGWCYVDQLWFEQLEVS
jgi:uncharacterized UBP type Zn finger protein